MSVRRPNMFGARSTGANARHSSAASTDGTELDLRVEVDEILFGVNGGPAHSKLILIRNMRRDSDGYPTECECQAGQTTREPDPSCSYCLGEGYLWDENWAKAFSMYAGADNGFVRRYLQMPPGLVRVDYKIFFLRYDTTILYGDKIIEVSLDEDGDLELPYVREAIHKPQTLQKRRADDGRIEFIAAFCREKDALQPDNPQ